MALGIKQWLVFAKQKTNEIVLLKQFASNEIETKTSADFEQNTITNENRKTSKLTHNNYINQRVTEISPSDDQRKSLLHKEEKVRLRL